MKVEIDLPLSRNDVIVVGAGIALGVAEVVSGPVAILVAASPLLRRGIRRLAGTTKEEGHTTVMAGVVSADNGRARSAAAPRIRRTSATRPASPNGPVRRTGSRQRRSSVSSTS